MTFSEVSGIITRVDRLQHLTLAFRERSVTVRGQLTGMAMIAVPAVTNPLPFGPGLHATVQILAVIVGFVGALIVFGGMIQRVFLQTAQLSVPHPRTVWFCLVLLDVAFALGAGWSLELVFTRGGDQHLADAVMLGLPAAALGWAAWRARVLWARP